MDRIYQRQTLDQPKLIAHRGFAVSAPQNSRSAFRAAGERGFWAIETDVRAAGDGVLVCCHDGTVDSLYDGTGAVEAYAWAELSRLRCRDARTERMPLFSEYLDICRTYGAVPFLEIKTAPVAAVLAEALARFKPEEIVLSSLRLEHLLEARSLCEGVFLHHIFSDPEQMIHLSKLGRCGVSYKYADLKEVPPGLIEETRRRGVLVCLRAGDTPEAVRRMIALGLDYIPTNCVTKEQL